MQMHQGFTSGGQLPKCWSADYSYMYKAEQIPDKTYCIYSEAICSDLANMLGIEHIKYDLVQCDYCIGNVLFENHTVTRCQSYLYQFSNVTTVYDFMLQKQLSLSKIYDILFDLNPVLFCQMLLFDFVVLNTDRHARNISIGFSKENLCMLPLYDHDKALCSTRLNNTGTPFTELDLYATERMYSGPISNLITEASKLMSRAELHNLCNWKLLLSCDDIVNRYVGVPADRRESIISLITSRTRYLLEELSDD